MVVILYILYSCIATMGNSTGLAGREVAAIMHNIKFGENCVKLALLLHDYCT